MEVFVRIVSAGHVDRKQHSAFLPEGQLLAGHVPAAGPLCDVDLVSVEATAGDGAERRRTGDLHTVARRDEATTDGQTRTGTAAWRRDHSVHRSVQNLFLSD